MELRMIVDNISLNDQKKIYLLNFKQPKNKKYMVLESDIECLSKAIHVIVFSTKPDFYIGRRITNDITISDISVSRKQAGIFLKSDNRVFVEDCDSKFGTFVKVNSTIEVPKGYRLPVQIEKKVFFFRLESRFSCFESCLISCGLRSTGEDEAQYDHYPEVKEKYPKQIEKIFILPESQQHLKLISVKAAAENAQRTRSNYNRVIDESMIT